MDFETLKSKEVEQNILGNIINDTNKLLEVRGKKVQISDFYYENHKVIYKAIISLFKENNSIDLITLLDYLKENKLLDKSGSITYVTSLATETFNVKDISSNIDILKRYSKRRKILEVSKYINSNINNDPDDMYQKVNKMLIDSLEGENVETHEGQAIEYLNILESRMLGENVALKTGLYKLDHYIDGFSAGDLITIFAFSGVGKTTLLCQLVVNMIRQNKKSVIFSLEMPKDQIRDRILSNLTNIEYQKIKKGILADNEITKILSINEVVSNKKLLLTLEDNNLNDIIGKIQLEAMKENVDIVFIDYINLITTTTNYKSEHEQVTECTRALKQLAKSIKKPIVILAQAKQSVADKSTNLNVEAHKKLNDNDIHGGASIFRDSDKVIGMYRNVDLDQRAGKEALEKSGLLDYNSKNAEVNPYCVNLLIRKCRSGEKGTLAFRWDPKYYRISNLEY